MRIIMSETNKKDDVEDAASDELELKSIGDFEEDKEVEAMNTIATKSHGHAIRDA